MSEGETPRGVQVELTLDEIGRLGRGLEFLNAGREEWPFGDEQLQSKLRFYLKGRRIVPDCAGST